MLELVDVGERKLASYRGVVADATLDRLIELGREFKGARVLHLNATSFGGGVSELLRSTVPILNDIGLRAEWRIMRGRSDFFEATKAIHNSLQGASRILTDDERAVYREIAKENADLLDKGYDFIFVHDPQPAGVRGIHGRNSAKWIWRCHIDTSTPNPDTWEFLRPYLAEYDAAIFTLADFIFRDFPVQRISIIPPAIDPLSPKNIPLDDNTATAVLDWIGVEVGVPLVTQISRFDYWKDPLGVIEAYRVAREEFHNLQLALVGSMALDDPEGWRIHEEVQQAANGDPLIHIFTNISGVGNIEVNAFQRRSSVVIQKSLREGFGLVVSEAMWKNTPVVAGRVGGIPLQMANGVGGILIDSTEECANALKTLLADPQYGTLLGESGHQRVREHYLIPRLVLDELQLMAEL